MSFTDFPDGAGDAIEGGWPGEPPADAGASAEISNDRASGYNRLFRAYWPEGESTASAGLNDLGLPDVAHVGASTWDQHLAAADAIGGVLRPAIGDALNAPPGTLTREGVADRAGAALDGVLASGEVAPDHFDQLAGATLDFVAGLPDDDAGIRNGLGQLWDQHSAAHARLQALAGGAPGGAGVGSSRDMSQGDARPPADGAAFVQRLGAPLGLQSETRAADPDPLVTGLADRALFNPFGYSVDPATGAVTKSAGSDWSAGPLQLNGDREPPGAPLSPDERQRFMEWLLNSNSYAPGVMSPEERTARSAFAAAPGGRSDAFSARPPYVTPNSLSYQQMKSLVSDNNVGNIPENVLLSIAYHESRFDPTANVGTSSAKGLMQVIDGPNGLGAVNLATKDKYADADLHNPATNIAVASQLLRMKVKSAGGDIRKGLELYYGNRKHPELNRAFADLILRGAGALDANPADPVFTLHDLMDPKLPGRRR